jgi:hypothetical protein
LDNDRTEEICEESSDGSDSADEEEYAPAELIQAHDAYEVEHDEPVAEQADGLAGGGDDSQLPEASIEISDNSGDPPLGSIENRA